MLVFYYHNGVFVLKRSLCISTWLYLKFKILLVLELQCLPLHWTQCNDLFFTFFSRIFLRNIVFSSWNWTLGLKSVSPVSNLVYDTSFSIRTISLLLFLWGLIAVGRSLQDVDSNIFDRTREFGSIYQEKLAAKKIRLNQKELPLN